MPDVNQSITVPFAHVQKNSPVIHLLIASQAQVSFCATISIFKLWCPIKQILQSFLFLIVFVSSFLYEKNNNNNFFLAETQLAPPSQTNPCVPSPCGPNSECRNINGQASCACSVNYIGTPPNCRPECTINSDCPSSESCFQLKCRDPCPGSCGLGAECTVVNHTPNCACLASYTGDPFTRCTPILQIRKSLDAILFIGEIIFLKTIFVLM